MSLKIEKFAPMFLGFSAAVAAFAYLPVWQQILEGRNQTIANAFGPVFDLATFSAGSLFAIYVLALSKNEGFLGKIFNTKTFALFHSYVSRSIVLNVILSIFTVWYVVVGFDDLSQLPSHVLLSSWVGLSIWAFASVARVVFVFLTIVPNRRSTPYVKMAGQAS